MIGGDRLAPQLERSGLREGGAKSDAERHSSRALAIPERRDERCMTMHVLGSSRELNDRRRQDRPDRLN